MTLNKSSETIKSIKQHESEKLQFFINPNTLAFSQWQIIAIPETYYKRDFLPNNSYNFSFKHD